LLAGGDWKKVRRKRGFKVGGKKRREAEKGKKGNLKKSLENGGSFWAYIKIWGEKKY